MAVVHQASTLLPCERGREGGSKEREREGGGVREREREGEREKEGGRG